MAKIVKSDLDKFYTKSNIVDLCLSKIELKRFNTIIEPSAGNGSFSLKIENCIAYDIDPGHKSIIKADYLKLDLEFLENPILVIGNPPFGKQASLAMKFIRKSSEFADVIAFILPKSFKKQSLKDRIPERFHEILSLDLPENSFFLDGEEEYNVPCVFQIWEKRDYNREKSPKLESITFEFVKKSENPDLSFRRVGVNAGRVSLNTNKSEQSHYFIKADDVTDFIKKAQKIVWNHDNTAGPRSISKQELIQEIDYS
jgi:predicted RNA methylase